MRLYLKKGMMLVGVLLGFFGLSIFLSACSPSVPEVSIAFDTVEKNDIGAGGMYERMKPTVLVWTEPTDLERFQELISADLKTQLQQTAFSEVFLIAAFQGWKPSTGYEIEIEQLTFQPNTLMVQAQLREPKPEEAKGAAETMPYHIIQINKVEFRNQELTVQLSNGQRVVASTEVFIP